LAEKAQSAQAELRQKKHSGTEDMKAENTEGAVLPHLLAS
jgi:hypothetical protein